MSLRQALQQRLRTTVKLLMTGRWREFWWLERLRRRGVELGIAGHEELGLVRGLSGMHTITPGPDLEKVLKSIRIGPNATIIDIGCGKGSALITMAKFPFSRIAGCDVSPVLIRIAEKNLSLLGIKGVDLFCRDAVDFVELDAYDYVFFFNPFFPQVFASVMDNIRRSLATRPRRLTIIYRNPQSHDVVVAGSAFEKVAEFHYGAHPFFIYLNRADSEFVARGIAGSSAKRTQGI